MSSIDFQTIKFLGKGSFGQVKLVRRTKDQKLYALKEINVKNMKQRDRQDQLNEIRILASIYHPNVLALYEAFVENGRLYLVLEYGDQGDLEAELASRLKSRVLLPENKVWGILLQCISGLYELHKKNIMHRDIKAANILKVSSPLARNEYIYKLADFGVSKVLKRQNDLAKTGIGTPYYLSPEIWKNQPYNSKTDIFSLGCLAYELCTLKHPYDGRDMKDLSRNVLKGVYKPISEQYSTELRQLVYLMLHQDPVKRPSIEQILMMPQVQKRADLCPTGLPDPHQHIVESAIGEDTMLKGGISWQDPEMLKTIGLNQQLSSAMNNNAYGGYGLKNPASDHLPSPAYQKRQEFDLLQQIHLKKRMVQTAEVTLAEEEKKKQNKEEIKASSYPVNQEEKVNKPQKLEVNKEQYQQYMKQAANPGYQNQIQKQQEYAKNNNYQNYVKANKQIPKPLQRLGGIKSPNPEPEKIAPQKIDQNILQKHKEIIKQQQQQLRELNQEYLHQKALHQQINYKQVNNYYDFINRNKFNLGPYSPGSRSSAYSRNSAYSNYSNASRNSRNSQQSNYGKPSIYQQYYNQPGYYKPQPFAVNSRYSNYSNRSARSNDSVGSLVHGYVYDSAQAKRAQVCRPIE